MSGAITRVTGGRERGSGRDVCDGNFLRIGILRHEHEERDRNNWLGLLESVPTQHMTPVHILFNTHNGLTCEICATEAGSLTKPSGCGVVLLLL